MKPLLVSTYDWIGGAARATHRLHTGLRRIGVESTMLVGRKAGDDPSVLQASGGTLWSRIRSRLDALPLKLYRLDESDTWSVGWAPNNTGRVLAAGDADLINLHWVGHGFLRPESLRSLDRPIVWTLHDMWAFTGGCHYAHGCEKYTGRCGSCPQLGSSKERDLSRRIWNRKEASWRALDLTIVTPSRWLSSCAAKSSLFRDVRIETIPYGLDLEIFRPVEKAVARKELSLPPDRLLILFGAFGATQDPRKGYEYLRQAARELASQGWGDRATLVVFGSSQGEATDSLDLPTIHLGTLSGDERLRCAYSAADVFVAPSIEDNLPNTVLEALACGVPVVAFRTGGMPDMIKHGSNGYLAEHRNSSRLAAGIAWVIEDRNRMTDLGNRARAYAVAAYDLCTSAQAYRRLFEALVTNGQRREKGPHADPVGAEPMDPSRDYGPGYARN